MYLETGAVSHQLTPERLLRLLTTFADTRHVHAAAAAPMFFFFLLPFSFLFSLQTEPTGPTIAHRVMIHPDGILPLR